MATPKATPTKKKGLNKDIILDISASPYKRIPKIIWGGESKIFRHFVMRISLGRRGGLEGSNKLMTWAKKTQGEQMVALRDVYYLTSTLWVGVKARPIHLLRRRHFCWCPNWLLHTQGMTGGFLEDSHIYIYLLWNYLRSKLALKIIYPQEVQVDQTLPKKTNYSPCLIDWTSKVYLQHPEPKHSMYGVHSYIYPLM